MVEFEGSRLVATFTVVGLLDAALLDVAAFFFSAGLTLKNGLLHFWNHIGAANHNALECNKHFDVAGIELSDPIGFVQVERTDLDHRLLAVVLHLHVCAVVSVRLALAKSSVQVHVLVGLRGNQIEQRNNVAGEVFQLPIQLLVVLTDVVAVNIQNDLFGLFELLQFFEVIGRFSVLLRVLVVIHKHERVNEILQLLLGFVG